MGSAVQVLQFRLGLAILAALAVYLPANGSAQGGNSAPQPSTQNVDALVREVIRNEIAAQLDDTSLWCYREEQQEDGKPNKTLQVCQTQDGDLERLMAISGRELDPAQRQNEDERIKKLIDHPEQLRAKQKKGREDAEQARTLFRTVPDAFRFQCENESGNLITLRFRPNPAFRPATRGAQVLHHMEGTLILDTSQKRLVEINGRLTSDVRFGGGLLGRLDRNGTFQVKQKEVADGHWDLVCMRVHMSGRALLFKTIAVSQEQRLLDYRPLPRGTSLQQAGDFLMRDLDVHTAASSEKTK